MGTSEFPSPEAWANRHADKLAPKVRRTAERQKLPKASMIGADRLLKIARAIWGMIEKKTSGCIEAAVKAEAIKWAEQSLPGHTGEIVRIGHAVNGKVARRENR